MSGSRPLAIALVLVPLVGCAGASDSFLAPLDGIEPGAGPLDPADAATAEMAAEQIRSGVITGDLLIGGGAAGRMLATPEVMPAAGAEGEAEDVMPGESAEAAEVRRTAAYERLAAARQTDSRNLTQQSLLLERWMSTRIEMAQLTRDDIRRAQQLLADLGYEPGPIDGFMGPRTRAAIEAFQDAQGLEVTGEMTPSLIDLLAIVQI
jgi:hypothetical protein